MTANQVVFAKVGGVYRRGRINHVHDWKNMVTINPVCGDTIIVKQDECIPEQDYLFMQGQKRAREQFMDYIPLAEQCKTVEEFHKLTEKMCMKGPATRKWGCLIKWKLIHPKP